MSVHQNKSAAAAIQLEPNDNRSLINKLVTDAFLIVVLTAFGYSCAFAYEFGYANYFGYPKYLIKPTTNSIVLALITVSAVVLFFIPRVIDVFSKNAHVFQKKFSFSIIYLVMTSAMVYIIYQESLVSEKNSIAIIFLLGLFILCMGILFFLIYRSLGDKNSRKDFFATGFFVIFIVGIASVFIALGMIMARGEKVFYFLKDKPRFAILRVYDKTAIAIYYDTINKEFNREYLIINFEGDKNEFQLLRKRIADASLREVTN